MTDDQSTGPDLPQTNISTSVHQRLSGTAVKSCKIREMMDAGVVLGGDRGHGTQI